MKSSPDELRRRTDSKIQELEVMVVLAIFSSLFFAFAFSLSAPSQKPENSFAVAHAEYMPALPLEFFLAANSRQPEERPLFPYSVIPRGVASVRELKIALANDPVAASHYAGFAVAKSHLVKVEKERAVYVSYRLGRRVFWTKHKVRLHRGETLISDGRYSARTRCGNRISETPALPVAAEEPPAKMLDQPQQFEQGPFGLDPADFPSQLVANGPGPLLPGSGPSSIPPPDSGGFVPPIVPIFCCGGGSHPPSGPPVTPPVVPPVRTPEPSTWLLLVSGIAFFFMFRKK